MKVEILGKSDSHDCNQSNHRLVWGLLLLSAGLLLYAFNTGILPIEYRGVVFSWPSLLVIFGVFKIINGHNRLLGLLLTALGAYLLAPRLGFAVPPLRDHLLPLVLVLLGLHLVFRKRGKAHSVKIEPVFSGPVEQSSSSEGPIELNAVFGGIKRRYRPGPFKGGEINCVFGGADIDLSGTHLPEGTTVLETNCVFGGLTLNVPETWAVQLQVSSVFGDFEEKHRPSSVLIDNTRLLVVRGSCVFGGGEIRYSRSLGD